MGVATELTVENKRLYVDLARQYRNGNRNNLVSNLQEFLSPSVVISVVQPFNTLSGIDAFVGKFVDPMFRAFRHLQRHTDMLFGGEFEGNEWVVSHGHYVGEFSMDWLGIPATGDIAWLHYVEFHRIEDGQSVESYLYFDMLDLLRQTGRTPLSASLGHEGFIPGPATGDGIVSTLSKQSESAQSLEMVDEMLARLYTVDEEWRPYWHPYMTWYGPSGYGSFLGVDGFARFQLPYESVFEKGRVRTTYIRSGDAVLDSAVNGHYARFGDGNYVASGGWPSHGGFLANDWLGVIAKGQMFTVRVADIWRRDGERLAENWVFVDIVDMLAQLGRDLFAEAGVRIELP